MADEFGQRVQGLHQEADSIVATDRHQAFFAKSSTNTYEYLTLDATGKLLATGGTEYAIGDVAGATDIGKLALVIRDDVLTTLADADGDYVALRVNSTGALWVQFTNTTIAVTFTRLDYTTDNVAIKGSTGNQLVVNSDGSINVTNSGVVNSVYKLGSVNLVKDTPATVVTETPASVTENFSQVIVSGAGYCEWIVKFGTTGSEAAIVHIWTTPSHPTEVIDIPDYISVTTAQTILVTGTNREKGGSPNSDFTGYATLIRKV